MTLIWFAPTAHHTNVNKLNQIKAKKEHVVAERERKRKWGGGMEKRETETDEKERNEEGGGEHAQTGQ